MKRFLIWLVVLLVVGGTVWLFITMVNRQNRVNNSPVAVPLVTASDWVEGNKDSEVTLIEYGDFQCPACGAYYPYIKKLVAEEGSKFKFIFRNFPLSQHIHAREAAYAAGAAGSQGKFWEMYALIFENQNVWSSVPSAEGIFENYAKQIGLNFEQFKKDRDSSAVKDKVDSDQRGGFGIGVNSTPTFYLNNQKIQPTNYQGFVDLIKAARSSN